jgi:WD40 repeat protein
MISTQFCPVCGAANELAHTHCFACGQLLATGRDDKEARDEALLHERYQLGATLGSGGFSAVYRARDVQSGREVAIKQVLLGGLSADETIQATDTFNRELSLLSALRHPQVPRIYDHFSDREHWYLVMDYLEGTTLETYLHTRAAQGKPIQVDEALAMALQLCRVLSYLHTREPPVIFRDLKPGNIIRAPGGTLCLIDFGIARHFRPGQARDTQPLGSPGYAAPEQYGRAQTTPQTDIYSLGALLHALLSGQDPAEQPAGLTPLRLDSSVAESELVALAQRMRSPAPSERPATVRDVATALEAIRQARLTQDAARIWRPPTPQDLPSLAGGQRAIQLHRLVPPGTSSFAPASRRVGRREVLIGLGVLAAAVAGGGIWRMNTLLSPPPPYLYQGHADAVTAVAWSPDGRRIASGSDDMTVQVWDAADGGHVYTYQGHSDQVIAVAWSPDGRRIASASNDHTVQVWDAASGGRILIYQVQKANVTAVAWSPDGGRIASASYETVQIWDPTFGDHFYTYSVHTDWVWSVAWSPDGRHIASASRDSTVQVWDAANGGHVYTFRGHAASVYAVAWSHDSKHIASASFDRTVQVWDAFTGEHLLTYQGHADAVTAVAWSPDGGRIASASWDQTVQVWDALTGEHVQTYRGHTRPVKAVAWSPDGGHPVLTYSGRIASGSLDKTVQVWNAL